MYRARIRSRGIRNQILSCTFKYFLNYRDHIIAILTSKIQVRLKGLKKLWEKEASTLPQLSETSEMCIIIKASTAKLSNTISTVSKYKKELREKEASTLPKLTITLDWCIKICVNTKKPSYTLSAVSKSKKKFWEKEA